MKDLDHHDPLRVAVDDQIPHEGGHSPWHRGTLVTDRFEIPYAIAGSGPNVLVCVNGLQQSMPVWRSLVKRMAVTGYRTVLFDFPNQGRAVTLNGEASLTLQQQVDVLRAVVTHVSPSRPVALIGGSWGSLVAAAYAAVYPDRVCKLVLGSFQARANAKVRDLARRGRALIEQGRVDDLATLFVSEFGEGVPPLRQAAIRSQFRSLRPEQLRQMYDQGLLLLADTDLGSIVDLGQISASTLVVNGETDPLVDQRDAVRTVGCFRSATLHIEPRTGHFLHFERPEILETYVRFLTSDEQRALAAAA